MAIQAARLDRDSIAQALRVDVRTIERWQQGRVPHPRHRFALAELLAQSEAYLWPSVTTGGATRSSELLGLYSHRADVPSATWRDLIANVEHHVDLLGFALLFLPEQQADLLSLLARKGKEGCVIRVAMADPRCEAVRLRDVEEGLDGALPKRIATALRYFRELVGADGVEIRLHATPMYNSIFRFDDEMLATPHLHARPGYMSPAVHLRRIAEDGVFAAFQRHFDSIWATTLAADEFL